MVRRPGLVVMAVAVGVGVAAEYVTFDWDEPLRWLPDLLVGLVLVGVAVDAWSRSRGMAWLAAASGFAWYVGTVAPVALYWHRGFLVHMLVAYPALRPRPRLGIAAVVGGYAAAVVPQVWSDDATTIVLSAALVVVVARTYATAAGRRRHHSRVALSATTAFAAALAGGAIARLVVPHGDAAIPTLLLYEVVVCGVAVGLAVGLRGPGVTRVTDLVVELGEERSGTLRDALARTLGDPALQVGYWQSDIGGYVDAQARAVKIPAPGESRSVTRVDRDGLPFALLIHDAAVLGDPALVEAVAAATRLTAANADLQAEIRARMAEVTASRRRLLLAADEERHRLELRLRDSVELRLVRLSDALREASHRTMGSPDELDLARERLERILHELHELARGLHPRELDGGLAAALRVLAERSAVPIQVTVPDERYPRELEVTAYYTCAEALANVAKHAMASSVVIDVVHHDGALTVAIVDDGVGGADPTRGSGLRGLADRIEALAGRLTIEPASPQGTRLVAEFPLGDQQ